MDLSIVVPVYNEEENIQYLYDQLTQVVAPLGLDYEIICAEDGSRDESFAKLSALAEQDPRVKVVRFRRNYGQTAGFSAGFDYARGDVVVTIDADLQNDPAGIPVLLDKMAEGYDVVIPRVGRYVEALHAIYSRSCLIPIGRKLEEGNLRLVSFFPEVRVRYIEEEEIARFDPEHLSFFNINEPADLERAEQLLCSKALGTRSAPTRRQGY